MSGKFLSECMNEIGDDLIADAVEYRSQKKLHIWPRVVAAAAVLVLLIGMLFYGGGSGKNAPFVSVIVYADSGNGVEIKLPEQNSAFSNVTNEGYLSAPPTSDEDTTRFFFRIQLNEYEKSYAGYKVYQDGEELTKLNNKELLVGTLFVFTKPENISEGQPAVTTETMVWGHTEKETEIEIHYLKEDGGLLLKCVIRVTPQGDGFLIVLEEVYTPK